jgi:hypothetical protein
LRDGFSWSSPTITYGYLAAAPSFSDGYEAIGFSQLSAAQIAVAGVAIVSANKYTKVDAKFFIFEKIVCYND